MEKMGEFCLRWLRHVWRRFVEVPVRRVDKMEDSPIGKSRGRPRKIISEIIRRYLDFNGLNVNMMYD